MMSEVFDPLGTFFDDIKPEKSGFSTISFLELLTKSEILNSIRSFHAPFPLAMILAAEVLPLPSGPYNKKFIGIS